MSEFASIPEPQNELDSLYQCVSALKQTVEALIGLRGTDESTVYTQQDRADDANLAGVDPNIGRQNLGLGSAAVLPSSTWFQVANNLREGTASTKRSNLGVSYGLQSFWVPANAWELGSAARGTYTSSDGHVWPVLDFDQTTQETVYFSVGMPKNWDLGTVQFYVYWTATGGSGGVVWVMNMGSVQDNEGLNDSYSTGTVATDTFQSANNMHIILSGGLVPSSGGESVAAHDCVKFALGRLTSDSSDTLTSDARLIGIKFLYNTVLHTDD